MGKKGGSSGGTTTTKTEPWDGQKAYLTTAMQAADSLFQPYIKRNAQGDVTGLKTVNNALAPAYYSGNTVAPQSAWTKQALQMQAQRALNGSPLVDAASKGITNIVNGGALNSNAGLNVLNEMSQADNPYVDELYQRANNQAQASLDSNFNRAGRYGSGQHEAAAADAANNLAAQMYGGLWDKRAQAAQNAASAYNTGIGQQVVGANTAQQLAQQPYTDAAMLSEAGGVTDDYQQQLINAAIDRYNYEAQRPLQALSTYNQLISGNYGGTSTAQGQQATGSRAGGILGGAMTGAGLGAALSGVAGPAALATPWGIGGAVLGGMLGLL